MAPTPQDRCRDYMNRYRLDIEVWRDRHGEVSEYDRTDIIFSNPTDKHAERYISGRLR